MADNTKRCSGPCGETKLRHFFRSHQWRRVRGGLCMSCEDAQRGGAAPRFRHDARNVNLARFPEAL